MLPFEKGVYNTSKDLLWHVTVSTLFIICKYICRYIPMLKYDLLHNPNSIIILVSCDSLNDCRKKTPRSWLMFQAPAKMLRNKQRRMEDILDAM